MTKKYLISVLNEICYVQKSILTKNVYFPYLLCVKLPIIMICSLCLQPYIFLGKVVGLTFKMYILSGKVVI